MVYDLTLSDISDILAERKNNNNNNNKMKIFTETIAVPTLVGTDIIIAFLVKMIQLCKL